MKFLVDAQLPRKFTGWLQDAGHDAIHTLDLLDKNQTSDQTITLYARRESRIVVSKDDDFVQAFLINGEPMLLLISTGNINNTELGKIIRANLNQIELAFDSARFVELTNESIVIHE